MSAHKEGMPASTNMLKQRTADVLKDKIISRFVTLLDERTDESMHLLLKCLIREYASQHTTCFIISSDAHCYLDMKQSCDGLEVINANDFDSTMSLFNRLHTMLSNRTDNRPCHVLVDNLSFLLFDCPPGVEFEFWIRQIIALLLNVAFQPSVRRLSICFRPIRATTGQSLAFSDEIHDLLEECSTSFVKCLPGERQDTVRCVLPLSICHRRGPTAAHPIAGATNTLMNKPAIYERLQVEMNPCSKELIQFTPISPGQDVSELVGQQSSEAPKSSFSLTLTDSEKEARSQLVLPYERQESKAITLDEPMQPPLSLPPVARIEYQPDCFDDLDDEDPDDDLDI